MIDEVEPLILFVEASPGSGKAVGPVRQERFRNGGKDMNRQLISMRVIDRYKLNPRILMWQ